MNQLMRVAVLKANNGSGDKNADISYTFSYGSQDPHELAIHCGIIIGNLSPLFRRDASTL
jgi:hypothetical protein